MGCPQKEQELRYNTEAQLYKSGDADVGMYSQFTHLPAQLHLSRFLLKLHVALPALIPSEAVQDSPAQQMERQQAGRDMEGTAPRTPPEATLVLE